jgi:two-component system NtrC family sensor kinase
MDVGFWLRNLALGQYESLFEDDETGSAVSPGSTSKLPPLSSLELRLTEALEREAATAEILRVIASSPTDFGLIFAAIAERSNKLVSGLSTAVFQLIDDTLQLAAFTRRSEVANAALINLFPLKLSDVDWYERTIREARPVQIEDCELGFADLPGLLDLSRKRGFRSVVLIPLLDRSGSIGIISVTRAEPGTFREEHVRLLRTFADQAVIAIENARLFNEVQARTAELAQSLEELRVTQDRLVQSEKLASLAQLTAGIAHEIKNPLNFVNNFSALSVQLIDELNDVLKQAGISGKMRVEADELTSLLRENLEKVVQHGKRADSIVKNMLLHSREGSGERRVIDVNALVEESLNLAYHGARAKNPRFNITLRRDFDPVAGTAEVFPQEITRVLLNLISNGFYALTKRKSEGGDANFEPVVTATTRSSGDHVEIRIRDNGTGISPEVRERMFDPFFTTKPAGEGTGLGLSMSHDIIVKQHRGAIHVETQPGEFSDFVVTLPRTTSAKNPKRSTNEHIRRSHR